MAWFYQSRTQILRFYWSIIYKNNIRTHKNSKFGVFIMKLSQSNFNLRWPHCYLVRSYLIATVQYRNQNLLHCVIVFDFMVFPDHKFLIFTAKKRPHFFLEVTGWFLLFRIKVRCTQGWPRIYKEGWTERAILKTGYLKRSQRYELALLRPFPAIFP